MPRDGLIANLSYIFSQVLGLDFGPWYGIRVWGLDTGYGFRALIRYTLDWFMTVGRTTSAKRPFWIFWLIWLISHIIHLSHKMQTEDSNPFERYYGFSIRLSAHTGYRIHISAHMDSKSTVSAQKSTRDSKSKIYSGAPLFLHSFLDRG